MSSILREVVSLGRGAGKLTPNEYFYYRLWDPALSAAEKRRFVGKQAQHPMHLACNDLSWYAAAADKLLFQTLMAGSRLPVPPLLAVTQPGRRVGEAHALGRPHEIARFLREPQIYPLFAKPIAGKYSLSVISADRYDAATDEVLLLGGERIAVESLAADIAGGTGYVIQRRLDSDARLARLFGPRLWSVRALVLAGPSGPLIHRAVAKIAIGNNPADNFWRHGNMLGAIELETGIIGRVVCGTGAEMSVNEAHPDTKRPIVGTLVPQWEALARLVISAAKILPGIRTQSWDVALAAEGPVLLEVNYGGDLNLAQLAHGAGVLDERYTQHLARCGYRSKAFRNSIREPSRKIAASDLDVPVLGQLTPPQLALGGFLKACPLQVVCFNAAFGGGCVRQQALEHAPRYPHHAAVFANFNAKFNSLPLGIPSGVIRKGEKHWRIR